MYAVCSIKNRAKSKKKKVESGREEELTTKKLKIKNSKLKIEKSKKWQVSRITDKKIILFFI